MGYRQPRTVDCVVAAARIPSDSPWQPHIRQSPRVSLGRSRSARCASGVDLNRVREFGTPHGAGSNGGETRNSSCPRSSGPATSGRVNVGRVGPVFRWGHLQDQGPHVEDVPAFLERTFAREFPSRAQGGAPRKNGAGCAGRDPSLKVIRIGATDVDAQAKRNRSSRQKRIVSSS